MVLTVYYGDGMFDCIAEYRTDAKSGWHILGYIEDDNAYEIYDAFAGVVAAINQIQEEDGKGVMSWRKLKRIWDAYRPKNFQD